MADNKIPLNQAQVAVAAQLMGEMDSRSDVLLLKQDALGVVLSVIRKPMVSSWLLQEDGEYFPFNIDDE